MVNLLTISIQLAFFALLSQVSGCWVRFVHLIPLNKRSMRIVQQVCRRTSNSHSWHQLALYMMYMSFLVKAFFGASGKSLVTIVMPTLPGLPTTTLKTQPLLGGCAWRWAHESQEKKKKTPFSLLKRVPARGLVTRWFGNSCLHQEVDKPADFE